MDLGKRLPAPKHASQRLRLADKILCTGYVGIQQQECAERGCCWHPVQDPSHGTPWCFHPNGGNNSYEVTSIEHTGGTAITPDLFVPKSEVLLFQCSQALCMLSAATYLSKLCRVNHLEMQHALRTEVLDTCLPSDEILIQASSRKQPIA